MPETAFAAAFGAYHLAEIEAGGFLDPCVTAERREREALEGLIAVRAPHRAGIMGKLERVADHVRDHGETYHRLVEEFAACQRELSNRGADLGHVGESLRVVARRFQRAEMPDQWVRLIQSAASDAAALA